MDEKPELCDFCMRPERQQPYTHFTGRFVIEGDSQLNIPTYVDTDGEWATCDGCHQMVLDNDRQGLIDVFAYHNKEDVPAWFPSWRDRMLEAFWSHYTGLWRQEG